MVPLLTAVIGHHHLGQGEVELLLWLQMGCIEKVNHARGGVLEAEVLPVLFLGLLPRSYHQDGTLLLLQIAEGAPPTASLLPLRRLHCVADAGGLHLLGLGGQHPQGLAILSLVLEHAVNSQVPQVRL